MSDCLLMRARRECHHGLEPYVTTHSRRRQMKRYLPVMSTALLSAASAAAIAASSIPAQAPDVPGNAGGGPVDCKQVPTDRNCVSMNPKNDSNSKAATDTKQRPANGSA